MKSQHKISIIGHFGFGKELLNGQTIKTKIIADALKDAYGRQAIRCIDTHGGLRFLVKMPFTVLSVLFASKNIVMLPAHKGLQLMAPLFYVLNFIFKRNLLYVVIGGWLPIMLKRHPILCSILKKWRGIFVETNSMRNKLLSLGLTNVYVMPNCKQLDILSPKDIPSTFPKPITVCTFSRVMKEKGIEDALEAIKIYNGKAGHSVVYLDIFGQIDSKQTEWFHNLMEQQPNYISYKGCVGFNHSVRVLKNYYALLFPTYYEGEGFAGTIIDAFSAGLPVIASDWHDNAEIVENEETGIIVAPHSPQQIAKALELLIQDQQLMSRMKHKCIKAAQGFTPNNVIKILTALIN